VSVRNHLLSAASAEPGTVLTALNEIFPMEEHGLKYFTIWYGVYEAPTRTLRYASAGHPPAVRLRGGETEELGAPGLPVGSWQGTTYSTHATQLLAGDRLYVFSDGAYEVTRALGGEFARSEFAALLRDAAACTDRACVEEVLDRMRNIQEAVGFQDDWSLLELRFR
jgi:sigma-B regulation protein RsbU (phosphoserine phosphatase)